MKAMDIIDRLDGLEPNQYSPEQKLRWLSILDGKIYEEVLRPREREPKGFKEYANGNEELLVPFPYGDDVYLNYLQAMVALENAETQRYNKRLQFFNNAYAEYEDFTSEQLAALKGDKGDKGDTGAQGLQGEKGEKGDTGARGPQGEQGPRGAQGPQGEQGETGPAGAQGAKGDAGTPGAAGSPGATFTPHIDGSGNETGLDPIYSSGSHVKITVETDSSGQKVLVFGWDGGDYPYDVAYLTPAIDLTDYKTLKISGYSATGERHFSVWSRVPSTYNYDEVASVTMLAGSTPSSYTIDVSSLSGNYYIGGGTPSNGTKIYAYDLRLE